MGFNSGFKGLKSAVQGVRGVWYEKKTFTPTAV